jgi:hypothetical protein
VPREANGIPAKRRKEAHWEEGAKSLSNERRVSAIRIERKKPCFIYVQVKHLVIKEKIVPTFNNSVTGNDSAIVALAVDGYGVYGKSVNSHGVWGESDKGSGVTAIAKLWHGVYGVTESTTGGAGVYGEHKSSGVGVVGKSVSGVGVWGVSDTFEGMHAETKSTTTAALAAYQMNASSDTAALYVKHAGKRMAAIFEGSVTVTGDVILPNAADCAEDFDIAGAETVEPGTVMVLCDEGTLQPSAHAYDKRVAGVISGAGDYRPGIVLDKQQGGGNRSPVALLGKVFCNVDASLAPIEVGDLLTTSGTPGHAMRVEDPLRAFGAVIGKALRPLKEGQGLIPILIALQ